MKIVFVSLIYFEKYNLLNYPLHRQSNFHQRLYWDLHLL
jgi:hypothetical protein